MKKARVKPAPPPVAEAHCYVIRIYQRDTGQWFSTVSKDAMTTFYSGDVSLKSEAFEEAVKHLSETKAT